MKFARYPPDEQTETNFASSPPYHHHTRQNTRFHQQPERLTNASTIVDAWQSVPISQEKSNSLQRPGTCSYSVQSLDSRLEALGQFKLTTYV
ncbi:hypothetical protein PM082_022100 [Marasmius tenuissimus]|nr:hypothetical protein PM082_022100 [Marasmius tenuissimus]